MGAPPPNATPQRSAIASRFMGAWFARFFRRHLNGLRIARSGRPTFGDHPAPLVVYCNHPSWWDAVTLILLGQRLFPERETYAPFDAKMLERYGVFRRLGAFPVDLDAPRGAAQFLRTARGILARGRPLMWVTAQGRFGDVRERPLGLKPGIAHLPEIAPDALFVPLALEYAFWNERGAEAFCAFGKPVCGRQLAALPRDERLAKLEADLTATLDSLGRDVIARDHTRFEAVVEGAKGIGGVYDAWRRLHAAGRGRRFEAAHGAASSTLDERNP